MKKIIFAFALFLSVVGVQSAKAQAGQFAPREFSAEEQKFLNLSAQKWQWMSEKNVDELSKLFHKEAMFVHMGGSWGTAQELETIRGGMIWYKHADVHSQEVKQTDGITFVYSNIHMTSEVGGREVTFPFMVTEAYVPTADGVKLASFVFTRLATPEDAR